MKGEKDQERFLVLVTGFVFALGYEHKENKVERFIGELKDNLPR